MSLSSSSRDSRVADDIIRQMKRWHRGALHSGVVLVVATLVGFAVAFAVDAFLSNRAYSALRAHRVAVKASSSACYFQPTPQRSPQIGPPNTCQLAFDYQGRTYTAVFHQGPKDPTDRSSTSRYPNEPRPIQQGPGRNHRRPGAHHSPPRNRCRHHHHPPTTSTKTPATPQPGSQPIDTPNDITIHPGLVP